MGGLGVGVNAFASFTPEPADSGSGDASPTAGPSPPVTPPFTPPSSPSAELPCHYSCYYSESEFNMWMQYYDVGSPGYEYGMQYYCSGSCEGCAWCTMPPP